MINNSANSRRNDAGDTSATGGSFDRRRFLGWAGASALAAGSLSACSGGGGKSKGRGNGTGSGKTLQIAMWTQSTANDPVARINSKFEAKHPGVKVNLNIKPNTQNAYSTMLKTMSQAKSIDIMAEFSPGVGIAPPPSYTHIKPSGVNALIQSGQLTDLSKQPFMKRYDRKQQELAWGANGGIYGLMIAEFGCFPGAFYKMDLLDKNGMTPPSTYSELIDQLNKLKGNGLTPIFCAQYNSFLWTGFQSQLMMMGHPSTDSGEVSRQLATKFWKGQMNWDDPTFVKAATRMSEVEAFFQPGSAGADPLSSIGTWAVREDDWPYFIDGTWDIEVIQKANPNLKVGYVGLPGTEDPSANRMAQSLNQGWVVPTWAPNHDLALEWLDFFSQPENYIDYATSIASLSCQPEVKSSTASWAKWTNEHVKDMFPSIPGPWVPPGSPPLAAGPDYTKMAPIGKLSPSDMMKQCAADYTKARSA